jgi:hypothetical protein
MRKKKFIRRTCRLSALYMVTMFSLLLMQSWAHAQYSGSVYKAEEVQVGAVGSDNDLSGSAYKGTATIGDSVVGGASSTNFQAVGGFETTSKPLLEVQVFTTSINLGGLSSSAASTAVGSFSVRTYLASGYNVYTMGPPPTSENTVTLTPLSTGGTSLPGTPQFGMNLRANTSPVSVGTDPVQVPDATFSFGQVDANYNTPNTYRYNNGERIAYSTQSTGQTNYTESFLYNISAIQSAGTYIFRQSIVVVPTY